MEPTQGEDGQRGEQGEMVFVDRESKLSKEHVEFPSAVQKLCTEEEVRAIGSTLEILINKDKSFNHFSLKTAAERRQGGLLTYYRYRILKVHLGRDVPVNTASPRSPLSYVVDVNNLEIFTELWQKGTSICYKDANTMSELEFDMLAHRLAIIKLALDGSIKELEELRTLIPNFEAHVPLFHAACWTGNDEVMKMFVSHKFSLNSRSTFNTKRWKGFTPLHFLIGGGKANLSAVETFLNHESIDFNAKDELGRTCLHLAFENSSTNSSIIDSMVKHMSHLNVKQFINPIDHDGLSHFHIFCSMAARETDEINYVDIFKRFVDICVDLDSSVSLEAQKYPGFTALHFAAETFSWKMLKLLLEHGADPTKTDKNGSTPLHVLYRTGSHEHEYDLEVVELLLKNGASAVAKDSKDLTPLDLSFGYDGHPLTKSEKFLLSRNQESINHTNKYGISYLHIACTEDDLGVVEALVNNGASVNSCVGTDLDRYAGYSPLHFAVENQHIEIVEFLLTHGADIRAKARYEKTPLHLACRLDQLHPSADKDDQKNDQIDWLPSRMNQIRIVELLIEHGADVNAKDCFDSTPLLEILDLPSILSQDSFKSRGDLVKCLYSELLTRQQKIIDILLHHGADINAQDQCQGSILHTLANRLQECPSDKELAKFVLKRGANVNAADEFSRDTPLHNAVRESMEKRLDTSFVDLLLEYGADVNAKSEDLETPLHYALQYSFYDSKHENIFSKLLNHPKIDVNASDKCKRTPLHIALEKQNCVATEKLLAAGSDINLEDSDGNPPTYDLVKDLKFDELEDDKNALITIAHVIIHVKKLKELKFHVSEKVIIHFEVLLAHSDKRWLLGIDNRIDREVERLKAFELDKHASLYDILFKDSRAMMKYITNRGLLGALEVIDSGLFFGIFGDIIKRQYKKGCNRSELLEPAKAGLISVTNVSWPDFCSEEILSNLCDGSLRNLMECAPCDSTI